MLNHSLEALYGDTDIYSQVYRKWLIYRLQRDEGRISMRGGENLEQNGNL